MKLRMKMLFSLLVTIIVFAAVFFTIKNGNDNVSVVKNEVMPFMGNNSVNYGGFKFSSVSDITGTTEASNIRENFGYDDDYYNESVDFKTVLKVVVNVSSNTPHLSYIDINTVNGDEYEYQPYLYYYNYQSSVNGNSSGNEYDFSDNMIDRNFASGDKLTMYLLPGKDVDPGTTRLSFSFEGNEVYEEAYTEFDMLRLTYINPSNGRDYVRLIDSYMNSFTLDEISEINSENFIGWGTESSVSENEVVYNNKQTFTGWNQILNKFTNNELYLLALYNDKTPNTYEVRFNKNGGSLIPGATAINAKSYYLTDTLTIPENVFRKDYYEFVSWSLNTNDDSAVLYPGNKIKIYNIVGYANLNNIINIHAYWDPIEYSINYNGNGADGELYDDEYTANNSFINLKPVTNQPDSLDDDLYNDGFSFVGFSENRNAKEGDSGIYANGAKVTPADLGYKDITLYAIWKSNYGGGGNGDNPDNPSGPDTPVEPTYYTLSFDGNNGNGSMGNVQVTESTTYTVPNCTYIRPGYTFEGWQNGSNIYQPGDKVRVGDLNIVNNTITFAAVWSGNGYVLSFDPNGGSGTMGSLNYQVGGDSITIPDNSFTRVGYNFVGWATSKNGNPDNNYRSNTSITLTKDVKLYAVWDPIEYYIIYRPNGVSTESGSNVSGEMNRTTATYDQNVTLKKNAFVHEDSNYAFAGWSLTQNGSLVYLDQATVSNLSSEEYDEIELFAVWVEKKHFTITFNGNGGSGSMEATEGDTFTNIQLPKNTMERDGYNFSGWATERNGKVVYKDNAVIYLRDISDNGLTLYAVWTPKKSGTTPTKINGKGSTIINNPTTSGTSFVILLVLLSCVGAGYVYSKRRKA